MQEKCWIGIDIGGTNIRIGAVEKTGRVTAFEKRRTNQTFHSGGIGPELIRMINDFRKTYHLEGNTEGISIGFPATLNRERTRVLQMPNVEGFDNLNVVELLEEAFQLPVCIERDVCMAFCYDRQKYHVPQSGILLGIYVGTGIGNVICIDGNEVKGKDGAAGELGHIPVPGNLQPCGCGNTGCAETIAGGKYLVRLCTDVFESLPVEEIFTQKREHRLLKQYVDHLAGIVATEVNIFNPDYVLLGGGVPAMKDFPVKELIAGIHRYARKPYPEEGLQIIMTADDEKKGVIGAALYASEKERKKKREKGGHFSC